MVEKFVFQIIRVIYLKKIDSVNNIHGHRRRLQLTKNHRMDRSPKFSVFLDFLGHPQLKCCSLFCIVSHSFWRSFKDPATNYRAYIIITLSFRSGHLFFRIKVCSRPLCKSHAGKAVHLKV